MGSIQLTDDGNIQCAEDVIRAARTAAADFYEQQECLPECSQHIVREMRQGLRDGAGSIQAAARAILNDRNNRLSVSPLVWTIGTGGSIGADAFGVGRFFQVSGKPGWWELAYAKGGELYIDGPFETQAQAREAAQAEHEHRVLSMMEARTEAENQSQESSSDIAPVALATDVKPSVQQAAQTMLDVWNAGIRFDDRNKDPAFRLVVAACFGAAAYDQAMDQGAGTSAMVRAFLTAAIDPDNPELDRLRANAAQRDDPVIETIGLYEGDSAVVLRDPPGNVTTYGPQAHALFNAVMACMGESDAVSFNLLAFLHRQRDFSEKTFGPGPRTKGVVAHIRKELTDIEAAPDQVEEWVDVILLAFDGARRAGADPVRIVEALAAKQNRNEMRSWPDWRTADLDHPIEHIRELEQGAS
ncbi:dATP/dGTP pyrophosphohydrolase domain-containing protein [Fodinicurvata sp. EGI_FJ10296]|uniref:dATP/dGTP pyrophosphohydrolase domain-containing protein n=1 Tax=Fodinicurvata sp. EGI_FJ10296 TaxID=3231908 RepID=UPI0034550318